VLGHVMAQAAEFFDHRYREVLVGAELGHGLSDCNCFSKS
jgi:hypothetical protein